MNDARLRDVIMVRDMLTVMQRHWKRGISALLGAVLFGGVLVMLRAPRYRADAGIVMIGTRPRVSFEERIRIDQVAETDAQKYGWFAERKRTIRQLIKSPAVVRETLARAREQGIPHASRLKIDALVSANSTMLSVRQDGDMFQVISRHASPKTARFLAATVAEVAVKYINDMYNEHVALDLLQQEHAAAFEAFRQSAEAYEKHIASSGRDAVIAELQAARDMLTYRHQALAELDRKLLQAQGLRAQIAAEGVSSSVGFYDSLALMRFRAGLFSSGVLPADLELKLDVSAGGLRALSRDEALATIDATIAAIEQQRSALRELVRNSTETIRVGMLAARIEQIDRRSRELADIRDVRWNTYAALERKVAEQRLLGEMQGYSLVKVAYISDTPEEPERRGRLFILIASLIIGVLVGCALIVWADANSATKRHA